MVPKTRKVRRAPANRINSNRSSLEIVSRSDFARHSDLAKHSNPLAPQVVSRVSPQAKTRLAHLPSPLHKARRFDLGTGFWRIAGTCTTDMSLKLSNCLKYYGLGVKTCCCTLRLYKDSEEEFTLGKDRSVNTKSVWRRMCQIPTPKLILGADFHLESLLKKETSACLPDQKTT